MATPYMGLLLPIPTVTIGPLYAFENNTALGLVDSHDHTTGKGVPVPVAGLNINSDFPFAGFNTTQARSYRMQNNPSVLALGTDVGQLYQVAGDLYYNNGAGFPIHLTVGNALNATSVGGFGGDYATSTATAYYTSLSHTFTFWSNTNTFALMDQGPTKIHNTAVNGKGVTLSAPTGLSADYGIVFPAANPGSTKLVGWDSTGHLLPSYDLDGVTLDFSGTTLEVKTGGIGPSQVATDIALNGAVSATTSLTAPTVKGSTKVTVGTIDLKTATHGSVTGLDSAGGTNGAFFPNGAAGAALTGSLGTNALGVSDQAGNNYPIVVSDALGAGHQGMRIISGQVNANGTVGAGTGFTVTKLSGTGKYQVNFSTSFAISSAFTVVTPIYGSGFYTYPQVFSTGGASVEIHFISSNDDFSTLDSAFNFVSVGRV